MNVYQLLPTLSFGDAVGNDVLALDKLLGQMGYQTGIYAENIDPRLPKGTAMPFKKMPRLKREGIIIYHLSTGCPFSYEVAQLPCHKIMVYHNITPPAFFAPYSKSTEALCCEGLQEMANMNASFDYCLADSAFNRENLLDAGYTCPIDVRPILIPFEDYEREPDKKVVERYRDGWTNILFVGRIAPNKKQEDVIRAFACYKKSINPKSRLILVGSSLGMETYERRLKDYIRLLGVEDVIFPGHISFEEILAYYHVADVFLCMSEHEGFCVPLVEAMFFNVPVIAYNACAVPDTLGGSGLLLEEKSPSLVATAIDRVVSDASLREKLLEKQRMRLQDFSYEKVSALFKKQFTEFVRQIK